MPPRRKETGENSSSSASSSKRQKKQQQQSSTVNEKKKKNSSRDEEEEDRISSLPDTILHKILSFLDMKHVVQTSVLSKRWTDLWASLGSLTFNSELFHSPEKNRCDEFLNFVDQVLFLRDNYSDIQMFHLWSGSDILMFHLWSGFEKCEVNIRLYKWIISVLKSKVRDLKIVMDTLGDGLRIPNRLFTCNSLTKLTLALVVNKGRWSITLPAADSSMCLPNLKDLELCAVSFHDENLTNKFFSSFPNLEQLYLVDVEFLHMNVNISALKLVDLEIANHVEDYGYCQWPNSKFKLHAPNLLDLTCKDYMSKDYILEDLSSLFKADIDMKIEEVEDQNLGLHSMLSLDKKEMYAQRMMQFLKALLYVKNLKLSAWFLQVISGSSGFVEIQPTKLCHLRCLRLETWLSWNTIRSITYLLNISPNLKSLFLKISESGSENIGNYPEAEVSLQCLLDNLECVEIEGAVGCVNELKFLEILLKNAKVLKKLVVYTSTEQLPDRKKRFTKFTEKLLTFPKASSDITILVC